MSTKLKNIDQFLSKNFTLDITESSNYQARISKNWIPSQKIINQEYFNRDISVIAGYYSPKFIFSFIL